MTTQFTSHGSTAFFTIDRPAAGNALTWSMYDALVDACEHVDSHADLRAFVIRATGGVFCTGTDISQFAAFAGREDGVAYERRLEVCVSRLERVGAPTVAQVEGVAAGAGCIIALACDVRVCSPAARFGVPIARTLGNGLSLENCARMVEHFGIARTRDLLMTGRLMDATEAVAAGVATRLAEAADVAGTVATLTTALAKNAPLTIRAAKAALRRLARIHAQDDVDIADLVADCYASADFREGVSAFLAKRPPRFTGH
jgi:enoyl-CoA hydratase/carnithine racemase